MVTPFAHRISGPVRLSLVHNLSQNPVGFSPSEAIHVSLQKFFPPNVKVLLLSFQFNIFLKHYVPLVNFFHAVKSSSVPESDEVALSIANVVLQNSLKFRKTAFKVVHLLGSVANLKESHFSLSLNIFLKNLNQKLCN